MAYVCKTLDQATASCLEWVDASLLPTLTNQDRDAILMFTVTIFATVFTVKMIRRLLGV